jgi:hypothetical protein
LTIIEKLSDNYCENNYMVVSVPHDATANNHNGAEELSQQPNNNIPRLGPAEQFSPVFNA